MVDVTDIDKLNQHLRGIWSDARDKWEDLDRYYNLTFRLWPQGVDRPVYRSPKSRSIIDSAVDNNLSGTPKVTRPPAGSGEVHKDRADRIEPFLIAVLDQVAIADPVPTWKQLAKHLLLYGYSVLEGPLLVSPPEEPDDERQRLIWQNQMKNHVPFTLRAPHPARVLLDPSSKQPRHAIKQLRRFAIDLADLINNSDSMVERFEVNDPYESVEAVEYWDHENHVLMVGNTVHIAEENEWGFVPFCHAFSGFGAELTDEDMKPEHLAVGMLDFIRDPLKITSQAQAGRHNALVEAAFSPWGTTRNAAEIAQHLSRGDIVPGIRPGDLFKVQGTDIPGWLFKAEDMINQELEETTFSRQLSGIREEGVDTVGQQAILSTAAARKFVMPQRQIEQMATIAAQRILQLIDLVIQEPVTVDGHTVRVSDIAHDWTVKVKFDVVDPVLQLQQRQQGMAEVAAGLKSKETYWSADAKLEDATGEKRRILKELVEATPEVQSTLARMAAQELGLDEVLESQEAQQEEGPLPSQILGPDGQPLQSTLGSDAGTPAPAANRLRQGLTPQIPSPGRFPPGTL